VSLTRHSQRNARPHSISAQLGKSLRLAGSIAAPSGTIAVEIGPGFENYALLRKAMDRRKDGRFEFTGEF
jgi:hypothetical protein